MLNKFKSKAKPGLIRPELKEGETSKPVWEGLLLSLKAHPGLLLIILAAVISFEIFHYRLDGLEPFSDISFWVEIFVYGLVLPTWIIVMMGNTERRKAERDQALQELDTLIERSHKLNAPLPWDDLVNAILMYPRQVLPCEGVYLHVYNPEHTRFELAGAWRPNNKPPVWFAPTLSPENCNCQVNPVPSSVFLSICHTHPSPDAAERLTRYCLPLAHGDTMVGLMHIDLPADITITQKQARSLTNLAPEIALALNNAWLKISASHWAETESKERQKIAGDLHDTLGQNIAYLHFKLNQMSYDDSLQNIADIRQELDKMREAASEAYEQMRGALNKLQPVSNPELSTTLYERSKEIGKRAGFEVQVECKGQPAILAPQIEKQVIYICREALNNIEKHAHAKNVSIQMIWGEADLSIKIKDDGVGFQPDQLLWEGTSGGHYGLAIMRERAEQVNGEFNVISSPGCGTQSILRVPLHEIPLSYPPMN